IVVKNVAGYDIARLMTGSFGSLALITTATFKLYPLPVASRTVVVDLPSHATTGAVTLAINASQLTPTAVEIQSPSLRMLIRFESTEASVDAQCAAAATLVSSSAAAVRTIQGDEERREWQAHAGRPWNEEGAVAKITLLPGDLAATLDAIENAAAGAPYEVVGRAGLGVLMVRLGGDVTLQSRAIAALRARVPLDKGSVTVLRG